MRPVLLPIRSVYPPGEDVEVEVRGFIGDATVTISHLGDQVRSFTTAAADGRVSVGPLPSGGYRIGLAGRDGGTASTAVQVLDDPRSRLRYGFVADYRPGRTVDEVVDFARRLHLTAMQFYDWAYRHADLVGGGDQYADALDQPVALDTVRRLADGLRGVGVASLGYAAVYAVGRDDWARWSHVALEQPSGVAYALGDFLWLVDPAAPEWTAHLVADLAAATSAVGFDGFHLDQYGFPRHARRADGVAVDLSRSFDSMIRATRVALPNARLVFNNVNDFPTWVTAASPQDAVYIEVWPPHVTLASLARVVTRARAAGDGKPVVIAAYQHVYSVAPAAVADLATSFTMATLFSHGATQLLAGEAGNVLVDPYYVRNHAAAPSTVDLLVRWYDFLVEHDELLMVPGIADVTGAWVGAYNEALDVSYADADVTDDPAAGAVWRRVTAITTGSDATRLVVHLINLVDQPDTNWDAPRQPIVAPGPGLLRVRRSGSWLPRVRVADPDRQAVLRDVVVRTDGDFAVAELPPPHVWQVVVIDLVSP